MASYPASFRPVALSPADEALELRDIGAADLSPTQDPDAFPPDDLMTDAELEALYLADLARRDAAGLPAHSPKGDEPDPEPPAPRTRHLDRIDEQAEREGLAVDRFIDFVGERVETSQGHVRIARLIETAYLYGRQPVGAARSGCRRRTAIRRNLASRGWEPGDEVTTTRARRERRERCQAVRLSRVAALERFPRETLTLKEAAETTGMYIDTIAKIVKAKRIPTTRVVQGFARWTVIQRLDLLRHFRRAAGL